MTAKSESPIILAFSGGLDTSFCVPWLKETYGREVVTVCINTGGLDEAAATDLQTRALALGAQEHVLVEARQQFFDRVIRYLIAGNVRRGHLYPLCVGAERGIQATLLAEIATERGSDTVRFAPAVSIFRTNSPSRVSSRSVARDALSGGA